MSTGDPGSGAGKGGGTGGSIRDAGKGNEIPQIIKNDFAKFLLSSTRWFVRQNGGGSWRRIFLQATSRTTLSFEAENGRWGHVPRTINQTARGCNQTS